MIKILPKLLLAVLFIPMTTISNAQDRIVAMVSQDGNLSFRVTVSEFYVQISQSGKITEYGALATGNISYDVNGRVDKIGSTNVSYDVYDRMEKIGSTNISYNVYGRVDQIGSTNISYSVNDKIDRIGSKNVSYSVYDKVDRIGFSNISYNVYGKVERISDSEGFIIFRNKSVALDE
jgi:hypothetical protein